MFYNPFGPPQQRYYSGQRTTGCTHPHNTCIPKPREYNPINTGQPKEINCIAEKNVLLKHSYMGEIIVSENTEKGALHRVASISIDTSIYKSFVVHLDFSCNVITRNACLYLEFQIFRQLMEQTAPIPISSTMHYARNTRSTESNTFSFFAADEDAFKSSCCNYSVYAKTIGYNTIGLTRLTDTVIICTLTGNPL